MIALGFVLAAVIGGLLGLIGGGGSILAVPVFSYVLGLDPKLAITVSFIVVGTSALVGSLRHLRLGNVDVADGLLFSLGSASVAFGAGAWLSRLLSGTVQMLLFAIVMAVAALFMVRRRSERPETPRHPKRTPGQLALFLLMGAAVGVVTGIAGVGGGFMIVPVLVLLGGFEMRRAVGTSLLAIAINSYAAFVGYLLQPEIRERLVTTTLGGMSLPLFVGIFTLITVLGSLAGAALCNRIPARTLRLSFAVFLVLMAVYIIARNTMT